MASSIVQTGFINGVGLLLDPFVVRTITVPAMAVIVGKRELVAGEDLRREDSGPGRAAGSRWPRPRVPRACTTCR
jgi:uncharacterized membrane protein YdfJ with MMPL/SSD domain